MGQMIYNTVRRVIGKLPIAINKDGLYEMLNILSLTDYNSIIPITEQLIILNAKSKAGRVKRERTKRIVIGNTVDGRKGQEDDR